MDRAAIVNGVLLKLNVVDRVVLVFWLVGCGISTISSGSHGNRNSHTVASRQGDATIFYTYM